MRGPTVTFRCDVGPQILGHRPHLFGHLDDRQELGEFDDQVEISRT